MAPVHGAGAAPRRSVDDQQFNQKFDQFVVVVSALASAASANIGLPYRRGLSSRIVYIPAAVRLQAGAIVAGSLRTESLRFLLLP